MQGESERLYTRDEAEARLPEVERLLAEARQLLGQVEESSGSQRQRQLRVRRNGHANADGGAAERSPAPRRLAAIVARLQSQGIIVRDLRSGLIDFHALREGRVVCLCWRLGEPLKLQWWHELDVGFAGRQPLD